MYSSVRQQPVFPTSLQLRHTWQGCQRLSRYRALQGIHGEDCAAAEPCCTSLATVAVLLAAFPGNPAQAVLASSSLLNLPFETTARNLSAVPSSLGMGPKRAHVHLLGWAGQGWAGKICDLIGGPWLGTRSEQNRPASTGAVLLPPEGLSKPGPSLPALPAQPDPAIHLQGLKTLSHSLQLTGCFLSNLKPESVSKSKL